MTMTTIKVSRDLRDRIAERARTLGVPLAGAIERALDDADGWRFWESVRRENESLTQAERLAYLRSGGTDDLTDADDEAISERDGW